MSVSQAFFAIAHDEAKCQPLVSYRLLLLAIIYTTFKSYLLSSEREHLDLSHSQPDLLTAIDKQVDNTKTFVGSDPEATVLNMQCMVSVDVSKFRGICFHFKLFHQCILISSLTNVYFQKDILVSYFVNLCAFMLCNIQK